MKPMFGKLNDFMKHGSRGPCESAAVAPPIIVYYVSHFLAARPSTSFASVFTKKMREGGGFFQARIAHSMGLPERVQGVQHHGSGNRGRKQGNSECNVHKTLKEGQRHDVLPVRRPDLPDCLGWGDLERRVS